MVRVRFAHGLPLLTRNRKRFARVPGLEIVPMDASSG
jgi:predicted nucleic acid-binding protein